VVELIGEISSLDDEVVVGESQGGSFEVTLFVTVRSRKSFVSIVVVGTILMFRHIRLVL